MRDRFRKALGPKDKGFTLIELLVVIIIIGLLAAIAIPVFLAQRSRAFEASEKSDAHAVALQMESWYTDAEAYPTATDLAAVSPNRIQFGTGSHAEYAVLSPTNSVKIYQAGIGAGYCIQVTSAATDKAAVYDSEAGGLRPNAMTCDLTHYSTVVFQS